MEQDESKEERKKKGRRTMEEHWRLG